MISIKFEKLNHNVHEFLEEWYFVNFQGFFWKTNEYILDIT
jgi:hypothetical protein